MKTKKNKTKLMRGHTQDVIVDERFGSIFICRKVCDSGNEQDACLSLCGDALCF